MTIEPPDFAAIAAQMVDLPPLEVAFEPDTILQIVGALQLALRHPNLPPNVADAAHRLIEGARRYFSLAPAVQDLIRRGDDPAQDIHVPFAALDRSRLRQAIDRVRTEVARQRDTESGAVDAFAQDLELVCRAAALVQG